MKEKNYSEHTTDCFCDFCSNYETIDTMDYREVNMELRKFGWITKKIGDKYFDFCCEECYQNYLKAHKEQDNEQ